MPVVLDLDGSINDEQEHDLTWTVVYSTASGESESYVQTVGAEGLRTEDEIAADLITNWPHDPPKASSVSGSNDKVEFDPADQVFCGQEITTVASEIAPGLTAKKA